MYAECKKEIPELEDLVKRGCASAECKYGYYKVIKNGTIDSFANIHGNA
jgi:hypothetical protein